MSLCQCKNNSLYYDSRSHHALTGEHVFQLILLIQMINIINTNFHIIWKANSWAQCTYSFTRGYNTPYFSRNMEIPLVNIITISTSYKLQLIADT
jgi:hypothetical protein